MPEKKSFLDSFTNAFKKPRTIQADLEEAGVGIKPHDVRLKGGLSRENLTRQEQEALEKLEKKKGKGDY